MSTAIHTAMVDHSALDGTGDAINGSEVDENSTSIAKILDGTTATDLGGDGTLDFLSARILDIGAAAGAVQTNLTVEWDPASGNMTDNASGVGVQFKMPDDANNQDVFAELNVICVSDATGAEEGEISLKVLKAGTSTEVVTIQSGTVTVGNDLLTTSATGSKPIVTIQNTNNGATSGYLKFVNDKGAAGADNDVCGTITFYGDDDNQDNIEFARIEGIVADASNGDECGALKLYVAENDGNNTVGLALTGSTTDGEVDVTVGAGAASVVTVPGHIDLAGDIDVDGTLEADAITIGSTAIGSIYGPIAGSSSITTVGTVTSGTWSGVIDGSATMTLGSDATGDTYYRDANGFLERLAASTDGYVLTATGAGSIPAWEAVSAGAVTALNDATANELVTVGSTTTELDAEARLTFDGTSALNIGAGLSGATVVAQCNNLVVEGSGNTGMSILADGTTNSSGIFFGDAADGDIGRILYEHGYNRFDFFTNNAKALEIASDGDVTVSAGDLIIGTSGKGIDFSATADTGGAGSMGSELLDDYEEGTWTPVLIGHTSAGTHSYTAQVGTYTKIGNVVHVWFNCTINTLNTSGTISGNLQLSGLPFTSNSLAGLYSMGTFVPVGLDFDGSTGPACTMDVNSVLLNFIASVDNAAYDTFTSADVASGDAFWGHQILMV